MFRPQVMDMHLTVAVTKTIVAAKLATAHVMYQLSQQWQSWSVEDWYQCVFAWEQSLLVKLLAMNTWTLLHVVQLIMNWHKRNNLLKPCPEGERVLKRMEVVYCGSIANNNIMSYNAYRQLISSHITDNSAAGTPLAGGILIIVYRQI